MTRLLRHIFNGLYWRYVRRRDVHRCHDCGTPTNEHIGTYWLTSDFLWGLVVGADNIVLCPRCFTERATGCNVNLKWEAAAVNDLYTQSHINEIRAARIR